MQKSRSFPPVSVAAQEREGIFRWAELNFFKKDNFLNILGNDRLTTTMEKQDQRCSTHFNLLKILTSPMTEQVEIMRLLIVREREHSTSTFVGIHSIHWFFPGLCLFIWEVTDKPRKGGDLSLKGGDLRLSLKDPAKPKVNPWKSRSRRKRKDLASHKRLWSNSVRRARANVSPNQNRIKISELVDFCPSKDKLENKVKCVTIVVYFKCRSKGGFKLMVWQF